MELEEPLLDTWCIHSRIALYLLDGIAPDALSGVSASKGRSVGGMFAHIHNVRVTWLELTPELMKGLKKVDKEKAADKKVLRSSLAASGQAMEALLKQSIEQGKVKGFKPHPAAFLGYAIAHEAYHFGEIGMTLKQSGHPLDEKVAYGM